VTVKLLLHRVGGQFFECGTHELKADHGGGFQHLPLRVAQQLEPLCQERLDRPRDGEPIGEITSDTPSVTVAHHRTFIDQHGDELLDEKGVALRGAGDSVAHLGGDVAAIERALDQLVCLLLIERRELHERAVVRLRPLPPLEQVGARRAQEEDGSVSGRLEHVLDQVQKGGFCPVDVVEAKDERGRAGELLEQSAGAPHQLGEGEVGFVEPNSRRDALDHLLVAAEPLNFRARFLREVLGDDTRRLSHDLDQWPKRDPAAVGEATSGVAGCTAVELLEEGLEQSRFPHAGLRGDRDEPA
jgi:hypothetical protein